MNHSYRLHRKFHFFLNFVQPKPYNGFGPRTVLFSWMIRAFFFFILGKSPLHNPDHFCKFQNNPHAVWYSRNIHFVNFSFYSCTPLSCACVLVVFIPSHSSSFILTLHCADGGVGNSSFCPIHHHLHMPSHLTHPHVVYQS